MMMNKIVSLRNILDYKIRQWIRWKRNGLRLRNDPKPNAFNSLPIGEQNKAKSVEARLLHMYDLQDIVTRSDLENYRINLYYLDILEKAFTGLGVILPDNLKAADIGCSSWFYVRGYYAFLSRWGSEARQRKVDLSGYEVDAYRPYFNLYSRYDYARVFSQNLPGARFIPAGFSQQTAAFDMISQFFPFIFIKDHLEWGLPDNLYDPQKLLKEAWFSLKSKGILLIVNQGIEEHQAQKKSCSKLGIDIKTAFKVDSPIFKYGIDHYVLGAIKHG